jgi:spore germination protein KA
MKKPKPHPFDAPLHLQAAAEAQWLPSDLEASLQMLEAIFIDVDLMRYRRLNATIGNKPLERCFVYSDGVVNPEIISDFILKPLLEDHAVKDFDNLPEYLIHHVLPVGEVKRIGDLPEIVKSLSYGDSLLLIDGFSEALLLNTKQFTTRAITEPEGEKILSGPREGFSEDLMQNLSLLRRKLRTNDLKLKYYSKGSKSHTQLCIAYMDSVAKPELLEELYKRLDTIDIDAVLDANYITELIRDHRWSVFRSTGYTERPDVVAGKLLEGRVAIFVDGTPVVLTVPYLFIENFQSSEDYYLNFYYTTLSRLLRILGFFLAITIPALYIAIVAYHHEMLPNNLMINIAADSHNVPLPASLECLLLLVMFDILRETGVRMPLGVGQALNIVGALVVGSAAVEADLVSAPMIIVTAVSGITSLLIPKMNASAIPIRLIFLLMASCFGFYGLMLGFSVLLIHILSLESFGVSQFTQDKPYRFQRVKDTFIRAPWDQMATRPWALSNNKTRQKPAGRNV